MEYRHREYYSIRRANANDSLLQYSRVLAQYAWPALRTRRGISHESR